jgi:hypothetical protein
MCFVTGQGVAGGQVGANDVDGGRTTLTTAAFDGTSTPSMVLEYYRWYSNNLGGAPGRGFLACRHFQRRRRELDCSREHEREREQLATAVVPACGTSRRRTT